MKYNTVKFVFILCVLSGTLFIYASSDLSVSNQLNDQIDYDAARNIVKSKLDVEDKLQEIVQLDVPSILYSLVLNNFKISLLGKDFEFDLSEKKYSADTGNVRFFNGFVKGYYNSRVALTIDTTRFTGAIDFVDSCGIEQSFTISHISEYIDPKINYLSPFHVFRHSNKVPYEYNAENHTLNEINLNSYYCSTDEQSTVENNVHVSKLKRSSIASPSFYAKIKVYGTYDYYLEYGGDDYYILQAFNNAANAWYATDYINAGVDVDLAQSVDIWDEASICPNCENANTIIQLLSAFSDWGKQQKIFGTYSSGMWNNDTDWAVLYDSRAFSNYVGYAYTGGSAGIKYSDADDEAYAVLIHYNGMFTEIKNWALSHEWGHLFSGGHEENSPGGEGPPGHRALTWCDWWFFGNCLTWRDTNIFYKYIFSRSTIGQFSRDGVHGGTSDTHNSYYIQLWRNNYLRQT